MKRRCAPATTRSRSTCCSTARRRSSSIPSRRSRSRASRADARRSRARLAEDPALLEKLGPYGRVDLIHRAVEADQPDGVRLIVELGVDVNGMIPNTGLSCSPLHTADGGSSRWSSSCSSLAPIPTCAIRAITPRRSPGPTTASSGEIVDYLMPFATIFDAVQCGGVDRVAALLRQQPVTGDLDRRGRQSAGVLPACRSCARLEEMIQLLVAHGANLNARNQTGKTLLDRALAHGWTDFANTLRRYGARPAPEGTAAS